MTGILRKLVERIEPRSRLGDVALSARVANELMPFLDYARSARTKRGQGGSGAALFHGPSGTGKTMAALCRLPSKVRSKLCT